MGFYGKAFMFDSTPCELYDLMMYDIGNQDEDTLVAGVNTIEDESVGDRWRPYFYGTRPGGKLEFDITFGVNERRLDNDKFLDVWEVEEVAKWLCGHKEYKWLYVDREDAKHIGYHCMITGLNIVRYGSVPWALQAHVICDSPYAYLDEEDIVKEVNGSETFEVYNESSLNDWYYPTIVFENNGGSELTITNDRDDDNGPSITDIPGSVQEITIDNDHCVISNDQNVNLYEGFNFKFLRFAKGYNTITVNGTGTITVKCEYPVNVGG